MFYKVNTLSDSQRLKATWRSERGWWGKGRGKKYPCHTAKETVIFLSFIVTTMTELTFGRCENSQKSLCNLLGFFSRKEGLLGCASRTARPNF